MFVVIELDAAGSLSHIDNSPRQLIGPFSTETDARAYIDRVSDAYRWRDRPLLTSGGVREGVGCLFEVMPIEPPESAL